MSVFPRNMRESGGPARANRWHFIPRICDGLKDLQFSAASFLAVYAFLLLCIPSRLIVQPIGSPGTPANLWGMLALFWWCLITVGGKNPVRGFTATRAAAALLTASVLLSYAAANAHGWFAPANIRQSTDEAWTLVAVNADALASTMISAADRGLMSFAGWLGVMLVAADGLRGWNDIEKVCKWLSIFGSIVASLAIIQYFAGLDIAGLFNIPGLSANSDFGSVDSRSILNRVASTATHPIEFGVVMATLFFVALHRAIFSRGSPTCWMCPALIGIALPMSVSRSAILALAVAGLVVFLAWPSSWRLRAVVILPFAAVGMRLMAPGLGGTIRSLFTNIGNDPSITGRTDDYGPVLALYSDHWLLGRGLFTFVPRNYRILDNQLLMTLLELGILGLLALLLVVVVAVNNTLRAYRSGATLRQRSLAISVAGSICGAVLSYLTFDALGFPMIAGLSFLLFGLAGAIARSSATAINDQVA
ncbi:MAG: O-antigen ligase family protein [Microlunatus sp.]